MRDYRTHLLTVAKRTLSTVNAHLTAIDDLYRHLGLGPAVVKRQDVPRAARRALQDRARTRWLRAVVKAGQGLGFGSVTTVDHRQYAVRARVCAGARTPAMTWWWRAFSSSVRSQVQNPMAGSLLAGALATRESP